MNRENLHAHKVEIKRHKVSPFSPSILLHLYVLLSMTFVYSETLESSLTMNAVLDTGAARSIIPLAVHDHYVFIDTTLSNILDRWEKLILPIHTDQQEIDRISKQVEQVIRHKWAAQNQTDVLRDQMGKIVT